MCSQLNELAVRPALQLDTSSITERGRGERALTAEWAGLAVCAPLLKAALLEKQKRG